jgi:hypothetical protein
MNALQLFHDFQEFGVQFELDGDGFKISAPPGAVTFEMRQLLKAHKDEIVELLEKSQLDESELTWRIEAMRGQLPKEGKVLPLLLAKPEINPKSGSCFSCGEALKTFESGSCCGLCARAKAILLEVA